MKKVLLTAMLSLVTASSVPAWAQSTARQEKPVYFGLFGALAFNSHSPNFSLLDGALFPNGTYNTGSTALTGAGGVLLDIPFSPSWGLSGRVGLHSLGGELTGTGINAANARANYALNASLLYVEVSPLLRFNDLGVENLYVVGGPEIGMPVTFNVTATETPVGDTARQYVNTNSLDGTVRLALALGVGYEFQLSKSVVLAPEASIRFPLTQISSAQQYDSWRATQLRLGANLLFRVSKDPKPDSIDESEGQLSVSMGEVGYYDENGKYSILNELTVEEVRYSEMYPLVPYVFFEKDNAELTKKHQALIIGNEAGQFSFDNVKKEALDVNLHLLSVVGQRLKDDPKATLTITGTHDGKEQNAQALASARAKAVATYLQEKFGIQPSRLNVVGGGKPTKSSTGVVEDGNAENRRAELTSASKGLLSPVTLQLNTQRVATPNIVEFRPNVQATDTALTWRLVLAQSGKSLRDFEGKGNPGPIRWVVGVDELASSQVPVGYTLVVSDSKGKQQEVTGNIPVEYISISRKAARNLPDKRIEKFSLILFDFDKSEVTGDNAALLQEQIIPAITPTSTVRILGYADRIGDANYNRRLATSRAEAVKNVLSKGVKPAAIEARGVGSDLLLFDNNSPIGRHLSRTVQIIIETPVK